MTGLDTLSPFTCESGVCSRMEWFDTASSAEDASGPTATCQITTYEPEPQLELPFEDHTM